MHETQDARPPTNSALQVHFKALGSLELQCLFLWWKVHLIDAGVSEREYQLTMAISFHSRQTPFSHSSGATPFPKSLRGRFVGVEDAHVAAQIPPITKVALAQKCRKTDDPSYPQGAPTEERALSLRLQSGDNVWRMGTCGRSQGAP